MIVSLEYVVHHTENGEDRYSMCNSLKEAIDTARTYRIFGHKDAEIHMVEGRLNEETMVMETKTKHITKFLGEIISFHKEIDGKEAKIIIRFPANRAVEYIACWGDEKLVYDKQEYAEHALLVMMS